MRLTFEETQFIRTNEGFRNKAYPDPVSHGAPWTIAWGLTGNWVHPGLVLTEEQAKDHFMSVIEIFETELDKLLMVSLNKNQYIALLDLAYNIGLHNIANSTLLKLINENKFNEAAEEFHKWDRADGEVINSLLQRRLAERNLFLTK